MKKYPIALFLVTLILSTSVLVLAQPDQQYPWKPRFNASDPETLAEFERQIESYITFRIILSSLNMVFYGYLLFMYIQLYNETQSKFSMGLVALSSTLLIYSLLSNPLILGLFRGTEHIWFSVFNSLPDVFASIAAVIMIYLSRT